MIVERMHALTAAPGRRARGTRAAMSLGMRADTSPPSTAKHTVQARMSMVEGMSARSPRAGAKGAGRRVDERSHRDVAPSFRLHHLAAWVTPLQNSGVAGSSPAAAMRSSAAEHGAHHPEKGMWSKGAVSGPPAREVTTTTSERVRARAPTERVRTFGPRATPARATSTADVIRALRLSESAPPSSRDDDERT